MGREAFIREEPGGGVTIRTQDPDQCGWEDRLAAARGHELAIADSMRQEVAHAIDRHGATWAEVGRVLGMTRQGARQRFARDTKRWS